MFAISEFRSAYGGGYNNSASQIASQVSKSIIDNQVSATSAVAWKDSAKDSSAQVNMGAAQNDFPPDYLKQMKNDFPPNLLKKAYEGNNQEFPPNMLKQQNDTRVIQPEFPKDVLKEYADKFPPNYLKELMNPQLKSPAQSGAAELVVQKQAILAYSSNAQA